MKKKLLALSTPIGFLIYGVYIVWKHFSGEVPEIIGFPMMVASIVLLLTGIAYNGYCFGRHKNPYKFK